jgi:porin
MMKKLLSFYLALTVGSILFSQIDSLNKDSSYYKNDGGFGGPKTIGAQLEADNKKSTFEYRLPIKVTKPWYDWKAKINKKYGLKIGVNYTAVYIHSSAVISDQNSSSTASGIFDIQLGWNLIGRKSKKNVGTLFVKLNDRHTFGGKGNTAPMFHGINESGYYGLPATAFRDYSIRATEINWQQELFNQRLHFVAGKVDLTNYFNFHGLIVPWQHFMGYGTSVSGTVNWPDQGLGGIVSVRPTKNTYIMAGLADVRGDLFESGKFFELGNYYRDGKFSKMIEIGFVPTFGERYFKKISFLYWHSDEYTAEQNGVLIKKGEGVAFSSHWFFGNRIAPYLRLALSNGNGENAFYNKDIQIGTGYRLLNYDLIGLGLSWNQPNIDNVKDQYTAELFYRVNLTEHFELTPSVQMIVNPTFNPNENIVGYFGFRGRVTL